MLFSRWWSDAPARAVVVDGSGKQVARVERAAAALVEDATGALVGLLSVDEKARELRLIDPQSGAIRWRHDQGKAFWNDSATAQLLGDTLYLATFPRISSGAQLQALDWKTGATRWVADVVQMNVAHSEYFNDVALELRGGAIAMRGFEAGGCYLQVFDQVTGKRRSAVVQKLW